MNNDDTYNGYENRETWAVALWLNNDEGLYRETLGRTGRYIRQFVEDLLGGEFGENEHIKSMREDVGSLWRVNWQEVEEACARE